jgi:hypothetical protein
MIDETLLGWVAIGRAAQANRDDLDRSRLGYHLSVSLRALPRLPKRFLPR